MQKKGDEHYWLNTCTSAAHNTWKGHAFERVAHNNYYNMVQKEINMDELFT